MIFASEEEISSRQMKDIINKSGLRVSTSEIEESVNTLNEEYRISSKPFEILKIAGGYAFATKKEYGRFIGKLFEDKQKKKLSQSALESLSIIAYKQPITRSEIEFIRGVNVDYIVNSLLERDLITITGRSETPGRPILYGTTSTFLKVLGLNSLEDLPKLKEINEILKNEEIEGITEADIELFNSVNNIESDNEQVQDHQLELLTNEADNETDAKENDFPVNEDMNDDSENITDEDDSENITNEVDSEDIVLNENESNDFYSDEADSETDKDNDRLTEGQSETENSNNSYTDSDISVENENNDFDLGGNKSGEDESESREKF